MKLAHQLIQEQQLTQIQSYNDYWDKRLTSTKDEPFPLAPKNVLVTAESYQKENLKWGDFVCSVMEREGKLGNITVFGFGLGRDLRWLLKKAEDKPIRATADIPRSKKFLKKGEGKTVITVVDHSTVALNNATKFFKENGIPRRVRIQQTEILEGWQNGTIDYENTDTYFVSQVLEHQGARMPEFMKYFAKFLRIPGHVLYLITPTLEDNDSTEVEWNHATPFSENAWRDELQKNLRRPAHVVLFGRHLYFNRMYAFFKVTS